MDQFVFISCVVITYKNCNGRSIKNKWFGVASGGELTGKSCQIVLLFFNSIGKLISFMSLYSLLQTIHLPVLPPACPDLTTFQAKIGCIFSFLDISEIGSV